MESLCKLPEVIRRTGLCKTRIYALIKEQRFPSSIKIGASSMWIESEVNAWILETIAAARQRRKSPLQ